MLKSFFIGGVVIAVSSTFVGAATVFSENFDSYNNLPLAGQGPWLATATSTVKINAVGTTSDKSVQINTSGQDDYAPFTSVVTRTDGDALATSFTIEVVGANSGDYFAHLSSPAGTTMNFYQRVFAKSSGAGFQLGLNAAGTGTTWGTTVLSFNTEYDIDILWSFIPGLANDTFALSVDDTPYLTHSWQGAAEPATLEAVNLRQGVFSIAPTVLFDDYVVQTIVPEPATFAILALATTALLTRRRRR